MSKEKQTEAGPAEVQQPAEAQQQQVRVPQLQVDDSNIIASYSNFCRVTGSPEELSIDFGFNPQPVGVPSEPIKVVQRIILNFFTAKRLLAALSMVGICHAAFPEKPIRFVVAFAPGSSTDIVARLIGEQLSVALGQPVIIENKPGAGGNIATVGVMNGPSDGYTLLFHSVAYAVNPTLFNHAGYDAVNDLQPVHFAKSFT